MKRILATGLAVLCFLAAVGIMMYPMVSSYVNEKYRSEIQTVYEEQVQQKDDTAIREAWERAVAYNEAITPGTMESDAYSKEAILAASQDYDAMLNITGNGIMGYVEIPKLDVYLPIFHGTGSDSLERGVGHLVGSSLPVGGENTHAVLTGHSGMASQRLFTDLEKLQSGDVFYLHVLDQVLAYQVDRIDAGEVKSYIQLCLAISNQALVQKSASRSRTQSDNEKYTFRTWLLRLGLIGEEFATARKHLLKNLEGNIAWKDPTQAQRQRERQLQQRQQAAVSLAVQEQPENEVPLNSEEPQQEGAPAFSM